MKNINHFWSALVKMSLIVLGLAVFAFGHMFKRLFPAGRAILDEKFGENLGKGIVALFLLSGALLMTFGYYQNENDVYFYTPPAWLTGVMHVLMLVSLAVMEAGRNLFGYYSRLGEKIRHPMLTGLIIWSISHLLVNGTLVAYILFGCLGGWSLTQIFLLNRSMLEKGSVFKGDIVGDFILIGIVALLYFVFVAVHIYLGANMYPFLYE